MARSSTLPPNRSHPPQAGRQPVQDRADAGTAGSDGPRRVHVRRLHEAPIPPGRVRLAATLFCRTLAGALEIGRILATCIRRALGLPRYRPPTGPASVLVTGTFFADNWIEAHVRPLAASSRCRQVWVVADRQFIPLPRVTYITPPKWLHRFCGRVIARSLTFLAVALVKRPDIIGGFHLLINALLALLVARITGARAMYWVVGGWAEFIDGGVHGGNHIFTLMGKPNKPLERYLLRAVRSFDLVLTMGTGAKSFLQQCGVTVPVLVMPGGIDPVAYRPARSEPEYDLITLSRLVSVKRLDVFLEAVRLVADARPHVRAVIVGDGPETDALKTQAATLGLAGNVVFAGRQKNPGRWLRNARIFVLTSDSEGVSLALMEAQMAGLAAVVSDVGDLGDVVIDGLTGHRPPPRNPAAFAEAILDILQDADRWRQFSGQAREGMLANTVEAMSGRWDDALTGWGHSPATPARAPQPPARLRLPSRKRMWEYTQRLPGTARLDFLSRVPPEFWLGAGFRRRLARVLHSERWSRDEQTAYQLRALQTVVALAYERSPYYRAAWRAIGFEPGDLRTVEDLRTLPTIDAETVRERLSELCTAWPVPSHADLVSTGGTANAPLFFYIGRERSAIEYAFLIASWQRVGYRLGTPMAVLRGRTVARDRTGLHHHYDPFLHHHAYSTFHLTDNDMARYLAHMATIGPFFLHVYPSSAMALVRYLRRNRRAMPSTLKGVIAESETVLPADRRAIEETMGTRLFSAYGHSEKLVLASECEHTTDYHIWPTYGYFELLDDDGRPVTTPGQRGQIVGTGFINTVMPFIRYRTGDYATYAGDHCPGCGRRHPIIRDVEGRWPAGDLVARDGSRIAMSALNVHDDTFINVRQFRFFQDTPGRAVLHIVPAHSFTPDDERRILRTLRLRLHGRIDLSLRTIPDLRPSLRGKSIYVDQRIPTPKTESTY